MIKQIIQAARVSRRGAVKSALGGLMVAGFGVGVFINHHKFGHKYGEGTGFLAAAVSSTAFSVGLGVLAVEGAYMGANYMYRLQRNRGTSSWSRIKPQNSATMHEMRQRSIEALSRAHNTKQRVLGNEALYLHR